MLRVCRREYKVMLDHRLFADRKSAAQNFCRELQACAKRLDGVQLDGEFNTTEKREIVFLDTRDHTINLNRLLFRQRTSQSANGEIEYTLKCRSPDRYVAAGADVATARGFEPKCKLEEDIGSPFVVRFSQSNTVIGPAKPPATLGAAAKIFPTLGKLDRDGERCADSLQLRPVNALRAYERVVKGPICRFQKVEAEVALILWSDGADGRPLVSEFSFRYGHKKEKYSPKAARKAMLFFEELQKLDWCLPGARTKTQFAYSS